MNIYTCVGKNIFEGLGKFIKEVGATRICTFFLSQKKKVVVGLKKVEISYIITNKCRFV